MARQSRYGSGLDLTRRFKESKYRKLIPTSRKQKFQTFEHFSQISALEIRELIIEHVIEFEAHEVDVAHALMDSPTACRPSFLPAICYTSKQLFDEAVHVLLRNKLFILSSDRSIHFFTRFLDSVPNGYQSVRGLYFRGYRYHATDVGPKYQKESGRIQLYGLELITRCAGLRTSQIGYLCMQRYLFDGDSPRAHEQSGPAIGCHWWKEFTEDQKRRFVNREASLTYVFGPLELHMCRNLKQVVLRDAMVDPRHGTSHPHREWQWNRLKVVEVWLEEYLSYLRMSVVIEVEGSNGVKE